MPARERPRIVVIGAGIIGLQTSVKLLEAGYDVTIVAKHLPGDTSTEYTSPWAGAHWRPHGTAEDKTQCAWDLQTYREWMQTYEDEVANNVPQERRSGIVPVPSTLIWESPNHAELQPTSTPASLWFAPHVADFEILPPTPGASCAARFTTLAVDVPQFLRYLHQRVLRLGGIVLKAALPTDEGLDAALAAASDRVTQASKSTPVIGPRAGTSPPQPQGRETIYINATGISARHLVPDSAVYTARGQTLTVRGVAHGCVTRQGDGYFAYCIPRPRSGVTILGGTKDVGVWEGVEDVCATRRILERARGLCPELLRGSALLPSPSLHSQSEVVVTENQKRKEFEVLNVNIGLRPMRQGGARMEREMLGSGRVVVHAYGHGGAGFQNSVGAAREVVGLVVREEGFVARL